MATSKAPTKSTAATKPGHSGAKKKSTSRCWPGYEPTPGSKPFEKGSCQPEATAKKAAKKKSAR